MICDFMLPPIFLYWLSLEIKMAAMWCVMCITKDQFSQRQNKMSYGQYGRHINQYTIFKDE